MKTITYQQLVDLEACEDQLALFRERFGEAVELTPDFDLKLARGFNIDWLARNVLPASVYKVYSEALTEQGFEVFKGAFAQARKKLDEAIAQAYKVYEEATAPARNAYDESTARAFLTLFLEQPE